MTSLLDVVNAYREDEGLPLLRAPSRYLPPRRMVSETTVWPPSGDLHACRDCGWPVWRIDGKEGRYDDQKARRAHVCRITEQKRLTPGSVHASAPGTPSVGREPPERAPSPVRVDSPKPTSDARPLSGVRIHDL